jgi:hypothetical protein
MKPSLSNIGTRGINEGHPPTTREWNEHEARQDRTVLRATGKAATEGRDPAPLPELTDEQLARSARSLYAALRRLVHEVGVDGHRAWSLRTAAAWCGAHTIAEMAARPVEVVEQEG